RQKMGHTRLRGGTVSKVFQGLEQQRLVGVFGRKPKFCQERLMIHFVPVSNMSLENVSQFVRDKELRRGACPPCCEVLTHLVCGNGAIAKVGADLLKVWIECHQR